MASIMEAPVRVARSWVPTAALVWAAAYGCLRVWFATGNAPVWKLPGRDLLVPDWIAVAGCLVSAAGVIALGRRPRSRALIRLLWVLAAGWVAAAAFALLDLVAGLLPGLGIPFDLLGMLSRFTALGGAALLGATALAYQRRLDPTCLRCTGRPRPTSIPTWPAWLAVVGCLTRLAAQAAVGFGSSPYDGNLSRIIFEGGFVLAGVALPLLLVYRPGRFFPRWMLLLPGFGLGAGITAYFGVGLLQMIGNVIQGKPAYDDVGLPEAFFWVAVPAYLLWGVGLTLAAYGYQRRTRKPCKGCGL
ncbi:hypothetical protein OG555_17355 [Kribbella sp. NBC_01484]|uniref:hypothetical protein n=1 Tax=Kribbella sp. NBC_01484 TaxID=2903579 RepID=UPI002E328FA9|nr:hypothetical protein [Kribbella sp. NBC_01484]